MTPTELRAAFDRLGLNQLEAAAFFDVDTRTVRRWQTGDQPIPAVVSMLLRIMLARRVSVETASGYK